MFLVDGKQKTLKFSHSFPILPGQGISTDSQIFRRTQAVALTEPRYAGPTSLSQLVSAVTRKWPSRADQMLTEMDSKYGFARVENVSGGPFIMLPQVRYPPELVESDKMGRATLSRAAKQFCKFYPKYKRKKKISNL